MAFPHKQGAYAETYRVKDANGKSRFLKLIDYNRLERNQVDDDGSVIEVEIAKKLQHHNLCRFIDSDSLIIGGSQYEWFATEFVSGETLAQKVARDEDVSVYEVKTITSAVLRALMYLHSQPRPIIHNEITIQNVMLNLAGELSDLKLIDFGHARFLNQAPAKPRLDELNPFYLAPERFSGVCSVQSDIYSVGVLMYHLLYHKLPWHIDVSQIGGSDVIGCILDERDKELSLPMLDSYEFDERIINIIAKALCYDADGRFKSAEEFSKALNGEVSVERQSTKRRILSQPPKPNSANIPAPEKKKGEGFAAIAGMEDLKQQMREEVLEPLHNPEEYRRYGVTIPNGMLLYGPPGCGKTFFAKHFAEEAGFNFMCITPATLKSRYVNATQENIAKMFKEAEENAPTIIFIDEFNEIVPNRDGDVHEMSRSAVNEMLAQMDRTGEKGVFVIGATNYPNMIDPAILRAGRLDKKYYIGVPDKQARAAIFKLYLKSRPYDFGLDYDALADLTENYVSADIRLIINKASLNALHQKSKITMDLLRAAIADTRPSLDANELSKYERIRAEMKGEQMSDKRPPRVGFQ